MYRSPMSLHGAEQQQLIVCQAQVGLQSRYKVPLQWLLAGAALVHQKEKTFGLWHLTATYLREPMLPPPMPPRCGP
jgi:hypothetical protein